MDTYVATALELQRRGRGLYLMHVNSRCFDFLRGARAGREFAVGGFFFVSLFIGFFYPSLASGATARASFTRTRRRFLGGSRAGRLLTTLFCYALVVPHTYATQQRRFSQGLVLWCLQLSTH